MHEIYRIIRRLGGTTKYKGYSELADAVKIALEIQEIPVRTTKDIYPVLARKYNCKPTTVEHNIRTLIEACWDSNQKEFRKVAGCQLAFRPTNADLIDMLVYFIRNKNQMEDEVWQEQAKREAHQQRHQKETDSRVL